MLRTELPEVVKAPAFAVADAQDTGRAQAAEEQVKGFTGDFGARVGNAGPGDDTVLRVSPVPLRVEDADGRERPVDLTLVDEGDAFVPKTPLQAVSIPKQSADGLSIGGVYSVVPVGADVAATREGEAVFYPNVQTDTDWVVRTNSMGAETHWVLRSIDSPEELRMRVALQPGAELKLGSHGEVKIIANGKPIGQLEPTYTWDANGQPVKTKTTVKGDEVVLSVPHRGKDIAYPIQADPSLTGSFYFDYNDDSAWAYWGWFDNTAGGYVDPLTTTGWWRPFGGASYAGRALYMSVPPPGRNFNGFGGCCGNERAFWYFRAPGQAKITHVRMNNVANDVPASLQLCAFWGIANADVNNFEAGPSHGEGCGWHAGFAWDFYAYNPSPSNVWLMGQYAYGVGQFWGGAYFKDSVIDMQDDDAPVITAWGGDTVSEGGESWIKKPDAVLAVNATDGSLGIRTMTLSALGGSSTVTFSCPYGPCPRMIPPASSPDPVTGHPEPHVSVSTLSGGQPIADGRQLITATVTDAVGHTDTEQATFIFDHNPPVIDDPSGSLWDARNSILDATELYELRVRADDAGSGVKSLRLLLDGVQVAAVPVGACPPAGSTSCTLDFTFDPTSVSPEPHTFRIEADDNNGHSPVAVREFTINNADNELFQLDLPDLPTCNAAEMHCPPYATDPELEETIPEDGLDAASSSAFGDLVAPMLAAGGVRYGIADNNDPAAGYNMFTEQAFTDLNVRWLRITVPFNVALFEDNSAFGGQKAQLTRWNEWYRLATQIPNAKIVVSFERSCPDGKRGDVQPGGMPDFCTDRKMPTAAQYEAAVDAFLAEYPLVKHFTAWNEPNNGLKLNMSGDPNKAKYAYQPTSWVQPANDATPLSDSHPNSGAYQAGWYWRILNNKCNTPPGRCFVAAGEFLDSSLEFANDTGTLGRRYLREYVRGMKTKRPAYWAWHAYADAMERTQARRNPSTYWRRLRAFMAATDDSSGSGGKIWLTEQGAKFQQNDARDRLVQTPLFDDIPRANRTATCILRSAPRQRAATGFPRRVSMVLYYQFMGETDDWDSGMMESGILGPAGQKRGIYNRFVHRADDNFSC